MATTTIDAAFTAILGAFQAHFGDLFAQYGAYEPELLETDPQRITPPTLLLWCAELEVDDALSAKQTPGRFAARITWEAYGFLSIENTSALQRDLAIQAGAIAALIMAREPGAAGTQQSGARRGNRWGLGSACGAPERVTAAPGDLRPGLHGVDSWAVTWEQVFYLSEDARPT